ncbi:Na/Pi cotransporter family protein [Desulfovibrio ferrophilus]|nr:Na/Pi symporter [Desulfovibrio ferrophilus]
MIISLAGGLGLLLLGMKLMSDGLKLAAGGALRRVLSNSTKTPFRGLTSGFVMTSAVQSSAAVTVAAIGFVNAGVMTLGQTVWVVYGSNIGTTSTAWIVASLGLKLNIKILALPLIAVGTALWLSRGGTRRAALGEALAGFGLFFLGIEALQEVFIGLSQTVRVEQWVFDGWAGYLSLCGIGFGMTFLMQSSSASMALILTATAQGMLPLELAASAVIGANLGSTSTAAIAVIGATSNAKRVAAMHVIFNLITGLAAFGALSLILGGILHLRLLLNMTLDPVPVLALFHTTFNILGVFLVGPFTTRLTGMVENWFRTEEEEEGTLRYLDSNVLSTPAVAVGAMVREVARVGATAQRMAHAALRCRSKEQPCRELHREKAVLDKLQAEIAMFSAKLRKHGLPQETAELIPDILRSLRYYVMTGDSALEAETIYKNLEPTEDAELDEALEKLLDSAVTLSLHADPSDASFSSLRLAEKVEIFEQRYQYLKQDILDAGSANRLGVDSMVGYLDYLSSIHRMMDQTAKGGGWLRGLGLRLGVYSRPKAL